MSEVKIGRMLLLSHGAYSSYERTGWFVVVQAFDPDAKLRQFLEEDNDQAKDYRFNHEKFLAWILKQGLMVEVEEFFDEWHMGDYMKASEVQFMPRQADEVPARHE